jgi:hypothetical protein
VSRATGPFVVKMAPMAADEGGEAAIGRMSLDKQYHGDLEATAKGQMIAFMTDVKGSAGYVAMEKVNGTLHGKSGTFVLQHHATMDRGKPNLSVTVVPDSGTGELAGLAGTLDIIIADGGKHSYSFLYTISASPG